MPVTDFECKIARGQIDRYLGGDLLSPLALSGLEEHLAECADCKSLVAERRAVLLGKLNGEAPTHAVVSMTKKPEENPFIAALRAKSEEATRQVEAKPTEAPKAKTPPRYAGASEKPSKPVLTKPIMLAGLLGVVLVGMNAMSRANGGKGVMGSKAAESFASETLATVEPKAAPAPVEATPVVASKPVKKAPVTAPAVEKEPEVPAEDKTVAEQPLEETTAVEKVPAEKPAPEKTVAPMAPKASSVRPVAPKARVRRAVRHKPAAHKRIFVRRKPTVSRAPKSGVRVYGLDGQPLK